MLQIWREQLRGQVEFLPGPVVPALCLVACGALEVPVMVSGIPQGQLLSLHRVVPATKSWLARRLKLEPILFCTSGNVCG